MPGKTKDLPVVAKAPGKKSRKTVAIDLGTAVKNAVKHELSKAAENKYITRLGSANATIGTSYGSEFVTPAIPLNSSVRPLLPTIVEGTDANQRIGNTITPKYLKVKCHVTFSNDITQSAIRDVRFMFLKNKSVKDTAMLTSDTAGVPNYALELLWNGQTATPTDYKGCEPYYNKLPINRKQWDVVEDKIVRIAKSESDTSPSANGVKAITSQYAQEFEVSIPLPAKLYYDGGPGVTYPSNFAPVLAIGWVDPMMTTTVGTTDHPKDVMVQWTSSLSFEDA